MDSAPGVGDVLAAWKTTVKSEFLNSMTNSTTNLSLQLHAKTKNKAVINIQNTVKNTVPPVMTAGPPVVLT